MAYSVSLTVNSELAAIIMTATATIRKSTLMSTPLPAAAAAIAGVRLGFGRALLLKLGRQVQRRRRQRRTLPEFAQRQVQQVVARIGIQQNLGGAAQNLFQRFQIQTLAGNVRRQLVLDRKSTRLNSSHVAISYAVFCLKKKT